MIPRDIEPFLRAMFGKYPVVTVTGPRQSGKTTLVRAVFRDLPYANLEHPPTREFARSDPEAFLLHLGDGGAVIDEIQRVPELTSYLQVRVDSVGRPGQYVLTGSHQYSLREPINQSLAGRTALLRLLPLSLAEISSFAGRIDTDALLHLGGYPRVHSDAIPPEQAYSDYFETYIERDLRQMLRIKDLGLFERFVRLCAGRVGQLLNLNSLAGEVGISQPTARDWMSVLESSFVVFTLQPWSTNVPKRYIKRPKLYFCDTGLAVWLSGVTERSQLANHPLRGAFYENLVISEALKTRCNTGSTAPLLFFRDQTGNEIDLLIQRGAVFQPVEIKSGMTLSPAWLDRLKWFGRTFPGAAGQPAWLVHPREDTQKRNGISVANHWTFSAFMGKEKER